MATQEVGDKKPVATEAGKRYRCAQCGSEVLVTKAGSGALTCCGQDMQRK